MLCPVVNTIFRRAVSTHRLRLDYRALTITCNDIGSVRLDMRLMKIACSYIFIYIYRLAYGGLAIKH